MPPQFAHLEDLRGRLPAAERAKICVLSRSCLDSGPTPVQREGRQGFDLVLIKFQEHGIIVGISQR